MSNKQKNSVVIFGVIAVISLIIFMHPTNKKNLFKSSALISQPFFPTQKTQQRESMQALLHGKLDLEGECLKVNDRLIVWPQGFSVESRGDLISVLDEKGKLVAYVGDSVKLGGGEVEPTETPTENLSEFVNEDCKGPLWITGEVIRTKK